MSIASLFAELGIVVKSREWSRGGLSNIDGSVYLLVWQDEVKRRDGHNWACLIKSASVQGENNPILLERIEHISLLNSGKRGYLIFCEPKWLISGERAISTFNAEKVYPIGDVVSRDGGVWAQYLTGIFASELRRVSRK